MEHINQGQPMKTKSIRLAQGVEIGPAIGGLSREVTRKEICVVVIETDNQTQVTLQAKSPQIASQLYDLLQQVSDVEIENKK